MRLFFLLFRAIREGRRSWRFWAPDAADVFAWLQARDLAEATKHAVAEMARRGYRLERVHVARDLTNEDPKRLNRSTRAHLWAAKRGVPIYQFYSPSKLYDLEPGAPVTGVCSRFLDDPAIRIDPQRVPEDLRPLLRYAEEWAIGDDCERQAFIQRATPEQRAAFVAAVAPHFDALAEFSRAHADDEPVPAEVIVLDLLAQAAADAELGAGAE